MKSLIRNILKEEISQGKNNMVILEKNGDDIIFNSTELKLKKFLDNLKLEPWHDRETLTNYLATNGGNILILISYDIFILKDTIYDLLLQALSQSERKMAVFLRKYSVSLGIVNFDGYQVIDRSYNIGRVGDGDQSDVRGVSKLNSSINEVITESFDNNPLKNYFNKIWIKQKENGKSPTLSLREIERLGLSKYKNEILQYYVEFMNLDPNDTGRRTEIIKNYLTHRKFSEKDIKYVSEFLNQGKMEIKIESVEFDESEPSENTFKIIDISVIFTVLSGSFYDDAEGEMVTFSSTEGFPFDDMMEYSDFKDTVNEIVNEFISELVEAFGFDLGRDIGIISVDHYMYT
jgi:hypothetical protein